jgi:hypothetical protein
MPTKLGADRSRGDPGAVRAQEEVTAGVVLLPVPFVVTFVLLVPFTAVLLSVLLTLLVVVVLVHCSVYSVGRGILSTSVTSSALRVA